MHTLLNMKLTSIALVAITAAVAACSTPSSAPMLPVRGSMDTMKAILYREYGPPDVLRLEDTEKPQLEDDRVLLKVRAAAANPLDWHYMRGTPYVARIGMGLRRPKDPRLGSDASGVVVAVGKNVTDFKPGDEVFGIVGGAYAEYARAYPKNIVVKPANVSFEQAAAVPVAAITALQALRNRGRLQPGQKVLINGASGGVGTFAVQIAKSFGAEVTGVCSTRNVDMVRSIGADHVIDYTRQNFTEGTQRYDVILDTVGNHSLSAFRRVMTPKGIYVGIGGGGPNDGGFLGPLWRPIRMVAYSPFVRQQFGTFISSVTKEDLTVLKELLETRKVTPVIDRAYTLPEVPAAIRYLEEGHARGKVIITVEDIDRT